MNKTILTAVLAFVSATLAVAKTNISVTTSKTQLVMQVKDNGRLYQTYLGARLSESESAMPTVTLLLY